MNKTRVLCECKESSSGVKTDVRGPAAEIGRRSPGEIVVHCSKVEIPTVSSICLHQRILEQGSPLGTENVVLEVLVDCVVASFDVESLQEVEILPHFCESFMVILVHWSSIDAEVTSDLIEVIARGSKRHFSSDPVSSKSSHRDLVLIHESRYIICIQSILLATSSHPN